jgi:hypothetical protein
MLLEAVIGGFAFLAGVVAISRPTKDLHPALKYTPIFLCVIGAVNVWNYFSETIPAVADANITVLEVQSHRMYTGIEPHFARKCHPVALDVYLIDKDKVETRVPANFVDPKDYSLPAASFGWSKDSVVEIQANPRQYESFYFVEYDKCAFDAQVRSEFGHTLVPQKFNAGLPTGDVPAA